MIYYLKALRYYESQQNEKYTDFLKITSGFYTRTCAITPKQLPFIRKWPITGAKRVKSYNLPWRTTILGMSVKTKAYGEAENYFKQSIVLSRKAGDSLILGNTYNNLGSLYNAMKSAKAIATLQQGQRILEREFGCRFGADPIQSRQSLRHSKGLYQSKEHLSQKHPHDAGT
jgi:tetratricopeptide (TPR) repeat protein